MDNNGAERAARAVAVARKNYYGSGSKWSGQLLVMLLSLLQTLPANLKNTTRAFFPSRKS